MHPVAIDLSLFDCSTEQQGVDSGMADYHGPALPDQFIDITDVTPGTYTLEITTDPDDLLVEPDETNNTTSLSIDLGDIDR